MAWPGMLSAGRAWFDVSFTPASALSRSDFPSAVVEASFELTESLHLERESDRWHEATEKENERRLKEPWTEGSHTPPAQQLQKTVAALSAPNGHCLAPSSSSTGEVFRLKHRSVSIGRLQQLPQYDPFLLFGYLKELLPDESLNTFIQVSTSSILSSGEHYVRHQETAII
jgi:hypothetical protein